VKFVKMWVEPCDNNAVTRRLAKRFRGLNDWVTRARRVRKTELEIRLTMWRTHPCVPRRYSCRRPFSDTLSVPRQGEKCGLIKLGLQIGVKIYFHA